MGGADLLSVNYINTLIELKEEVCVILTENEDSDCLDKLNPKVMLFKAGKFLEETSREFGLKVFTRIIQQLPVKSVHVINSQPAFDMLFFHGIVIKKVCPVYLHLFCKDSDEEDNLFGFAFNPAWKAFPHVTKVITENLTFISFITDLYGYPKEKFTCIYQPIKSIEEKVVASSENEPLRILWAGRFDSQKRPNLLIEVIRKLEKDNNIRFDIYGKNVLNRNDYQQQFKKFKNVTLHSPFSTWRDLETEKFDMFLYTSAFDGMPNIVLEALSKGLVVNSFNIGGINEIIENGVNGFLVNEEEGIKGIIKNIYKLKDDRKLKISFFENTKVKLEKNHSYQVFRQRVSEELNLKEASENIIIGNV
jgi:glycosyltransferase involved in cell wall biosynthesis